VEYLLAHGADIYAENKEGLTPGDLAVREHHNLIAQLLESRMVFGMERMASAASEAGAAPEEDADEDDEDADEEEVYCGLKPQDLQEAKDQLLVETADMLQVGSILNV
jgi:ankyrin repeat/IBR domain-containing protein 1